MNVNYNEVSFKGYDARKLNGLFVTDRSCAKALEKICKPLGVDIYVPKIQSKELQKEYESLVEKNQMLWAQDYLTFTRPKKDSKKHIVFFDDSRDFLKNVLHATCEKFLSIPIDPHLRGGNFFVCEVNGKKKLLVSKNKLIYPKKLFKKFYAVDEICPISKLDYHLDLFIRPLKDGNVLVSDTDLTVKNLEQGLDKFNNYLSTHQLSPEDKEKIEAIIKNIKHELGFWEVTNKFQNEEYPQRNLSNVLDDLKSAGLKPIRVPANYYRFEVMQSTEKIAQLEKQEKEWMDKELLKYKDKPKAEQMLIKLFLQSQIDAQKCSNKYYGTEIYTKYQNNFINAITPEIDGEIHYITNTSLLDKNLGITPDIEEKVGFSTKQVFIDSIKDYIKPENIHFIDETLTEKLFNYMGGVHCVASEIC